jgi:hypothetical protein
MEEENKTLYDAAKEAQNLTKDFEEKVKSKEKKFIENAAVIISVATIVLFIVLYAYSTGYYQVYGIPSNYFKMDLMMYLPVAIQICGLFMWMTYYFGSWKTDRVLKKNKINLLRIFWGFTIIMYILDSNGIIRSWSLLCSVIIAVIVEVVNYLTPKIKLNKNMELSGVEYKYKVEDMTDDRIQFIVFRKGVFIVILLVLFAPSWGQLKAINRTDYEIFDVEEETYVVIVDYQETALVQNAQMQGAELLIDTAIYKIIDKKDIDIKYKKFDRVTIK